MSERRIRVERGPPEGTKIEIDYEMWVIESYEEDPAAIWSFMYDGDDADDLPPEANAQTQIAVLRKVES